VARTKVFDPAVKKFYEEIYLNPNSDFNKFRVGVSTDHIPYSGPFKQLDSQARFYLKRALERYKKFLPTFQRIKKDSLVDLKEAGKLVGLPEKVNPAGRVTSGLRMSVVDTATRSRESPVATKFLNNVLKKKLNLQKIDVGQGQPTYFIKKPNAQEIEVLKDYYLTRGSFKGGLTPETISLVEEFHNNPTYKPFTSKGQIIPKELLPKNITINQAAYGQHKLAQLYDGKKFPNTDIDVPLNKKAARSYYRLLAKAPFHNPYKMAQTKDAMDTITRELGKDYFTVGDKQTNMDAVRRKIKRLFLKEGIPFYDKRSKNPFGVNINEIVGITASSQTPGAAPYSQFINLLEGKVNQADYALFQKRFQGYLNNLTGEIAKGDDGSPLKIIRQYNKWTKGYLDKITDPAARQAIKEMGFPTLSLRSPEKIYGTKRITQLTAQGLDLPSAYEKMKFTIGVPKGTPTLKEVAQSPSAFINQAKKILLNQIKKAPSRSCQLILSQQTGGIARTCIQAINKDPIGSAKKLSKLEAPSGPLTNIKNVANKIVNFFVPKPDMPSVKYDDTLGAFVDTKTDNIASQAELKTWADEHPMEVKVGEAKPGVLRKIGKAVAHVGLPLPTAALDAYFIGRQIEEGKSPTEIAKDPFNWLGLATMEPLTKAAGMTEKSGKLASALRLGMSPGMIRGASRFLGLPGLALSTGLTAYDQYQKYKNKEGFIYDLFNREEIDNAQV
jgi:hypothetical protein